MCCSTAAVLPLLLAGLPLPLPLTVLPLPALLHSEQREKSLHAGEAAARLSASQGLRMLLAGRQHAISPPHQHGRRLASSPHHQPGSTGIQAHQTTHDTFPDVPFANVKFGQCALPQPSWVVPAQTTAEHESRVNVI